MRYFTNFDAFECGILQISMLLNAIFYSFFRKYLLRSTDRKNFYSSFIASVILLLHMRQAGLTVPMRTLHNIIRKRRGWRRRSEWQNCRTRVGRQGSDWRRGRKVLLWWRTGTRWCSRWLRWRWSAAMPREWSPRWIRTARLWTLNIYTDNTAYQDLFCNHRQLRIRLRGLNRHKTPVMLDEVRGSCVRTIHNHVYSGKRIDTWNNWQLN